MRIKDFFKLVIIYTTFYGIWHLSEPLPSLVRFVLTMLLVGYALGFSVAYLLGLKPLMIFRAYRKYAELKNERNESFAVGEIMKLMMQPGNALEELNDSTEDE